MSITRTALKDRSGHVFYLERVGDRNYPEFANYADKDYSLLLEKVRNLELQSDDVIMVGYPKSGNNWTFEIINMIMGETTEYTKARMADKFLDLLPLEELDRLHERPAPRLINTHMPMDEFPKQVVEKKPRLVFIIRNFKDMIVSMYTWGKVINTYLAYKGTWEDYLDLHLRGQFVYTGWFNHVRLMAEFMKAHPEVPVHLLYYEKLKGNPTEEIRKLCHFLNKPDHLAEEIARKLDFKVVKKEMKKFDDWDKAICEPGADIGFLRKGEVGDWRNHFTKEQSDATNRVFLETVGDTPIGSTLKPYMGL